MLCALHRADSFISSDPGTSGTGVAAYRWNGFGFSNIPDEAVTARCRKEMARGD